MATAVSSILKYLENNAQDYRMDQNIDMPLRAKKRRLDHLSWEEKVQRKKLKNRVAAQTSRDRKKAKMEQMEHALQQLFSKNEILISECQNLKLANQRLSQENAELYNRLRSPCTHCTQNRNTVECETLNGSTESLLRQQGRATHSAAILNKQQLVLLWKIILSCLLYRTCSTNSMQTSTLTLWSNSPRACYKISPETWKRLLRKQIVNNQTAMNKLTLKKWWGRHQRSWNPVAARC